MKKIIKELYPYVIIVVVVILVRTFIITPVIVSGNSMKPNFNDGELLLVRKIKYNEKTIKRFDVVVIKKDKEEIIKRVIGLPGDKVEYIDNKLYINGEYIKEPFLNDDVYTTNFSLSDINLEKIPENCYLVLGDNREISLDSRTFGCFSKDKILGSANLVLFPFTKLGYKK